LSLPLGVTLPCPPVLNLLNPFFFQVHFFRPAVFLDRRPRWFFPALPPRSPVSWVAWKGLFFWGGGPPPPDRAGKSPVFFFFPPSSQPGQKVFFFFLLLGKLYPSSIPILPQTQPKTPCCRKEPPNLFPVSPRNRHIDFYCETLLSNPRLALSFSSPERLLRRNTCSFPIKRPLADFLSQGTDPVPEDLVFSPKGLE